jgi:SAM-dependent methyltransferase
MGFAHRLAGQLARPHGFAGRALGDAMDIANRRPTRLALDALMPRTGERILDAGCGTGAALDALRGRADVAVAGVDPSSTMIAAARRRLGTCADLHTVSIGEMPFAEASFDAVLLLNVLYFSDAEGRMVADLHRVLKPGGRLIAYVTHRATMERWRFAQAGFHRLFDEVELAGALASGGFVQDRISVQEVQVTRSVRGLLARATR